MNKATVKFEDTGSGIPQEQLKLMFKMLCTTKKTGSGFELAICVNIINLHKGSINVVSQIGDGTMVAIILQSVSFLLTVKEICGILR